MSSRFILYTIFHCSPALTFINLGNAYIKSDLQVTNTTTDSSKVGKRNWIQQSILCYCPFRMSMPLLWSASFFECERDKVFTTPDHFSLILWLLTYVGVVIGGRGSDRSYSAFKSFWEVHIYELRYCNYEVSCIQFKG